MLCPPEYERDPRFAKSVQDMYNSTREDVCKFVLNPSENTLASASNDEYTVVITNDSRVLYIRGDMPNKPAGAGFWMDWPENHWGWSTQEYYNLPEEERAELEAKEQLNYWIDDEYKELFTETWCPNLWDDFWWNEKGSRLKINHDPRYDSRVNELFEECKVRITN